MAVVPNPASEIVPKLEGIHLFHFDGAPCAQRVRFALHEKGLLRGREVPFDAQDQDAVKGESGRWVSRQVSLVKKQHMTETYAKIQPNLVVPALVHDGVLHVESMDIIEYLDEAFGGAPLAPKDNVELAYLVQSLTELGKSLHRSIRFVTFRWGLRGLARLSVAEEAQLKALLRDAKDGEKLVDFYQGYDKQTIPDEVYLSHLDKLNEAIRDLDQQLQDGREFLTGNHLTMADVIWSMKSLRLLECGYPFQQCFPAFYEWFLRIAARPSFQAGVMGKHRFMSRAFRAKATVEHWLGIGLKREVLKRVA